MIQFVNSSLFYFFFIRYIVSIIFCALVIIFHNCKRSYSYNNRHTQHNCFLVDHYKMTTICASTNKHCIFVSVPFYVISHKCTHTTNNASQSENKLHKSLYIKTIHEPKSPSINAFYYRCTFYFPSNRNPYYFQNHNRNSEKQHPIHE